MRTSNYRIQVTADSVDVYCDTPFRSTASQRFFGGLAVVCSLAMLYFPIFRPGRGLGIWEMLIESREGSGEFKLHLFELVFVAAIGVFFLAAGIRYCLPLGERLHCDRSTLTWSRIPWVSLGNRWVTRSIPVTEIAGASYAIVYKSKGVYGILLDTYGKPWKMFWQIESPEANRILRGLKALGVNVHHDPEMREVIRETLRDRRAQL
jgi:hypothetical protein